MSWCRGGKTKMFKPQKNWSEINVFLYFFKKNLERGKRPKERKKERCSPAFPASFNCLFNLWHVVDHEFFVVHWIFAHVTRVGQNNNIPLFAWHYFGLTLVFDLYSWIWWSFRIMINLMCVYVLGFLCVPLAIGGKGGRQREKKEGVDPLQLVVEEWKLTKALTTGYFFPKHSHQTSHCLQPIDSDWSYK